RHDTAITAELTVAAGTENGFGVDPGVLDGALHPLLADRDDLRVPYSWEGVRLHRPGVLPVRARLEPTGSDAVRIQLLDGEGAVVIDVDRLRLSPLDVAALRRAGDPADDLHVPVWVPLSAATDPGEALPVARTAGEVSAHSDDGLIVIDATFESGGSDDAPVTRTHDTVARIHAALSA